MKKQQVSLILLWLALAPVVNAQSEENNGGNGILAIMPFELYTGAYAINANVGYGNTEAFSIPFGLNVRYNLNPKNGLRFSAQYHRSRQISRTYRAFNDTINYYSGYDRIDVESVMRYSFATLGIDYIRYLGVGDVEEGRMYFYAGLGYSTGKLRVTHMYYPNNMYPVESYVHEVVAFRGSNPRIAHIQLRIGLTWEFLIREYFLTVGYDSTLPLNIFDIAVNSPSSQTRVAPVTVGLSIGFRFYADQIFNL